MSETVHVAVFDTLADWELGYLTAHVRRPSWQRDPERYRLVTVGVTTAPITTMGGLRVVPELALADLDPADSALLVLAGGDTWAESELAGFRSAARRFVEADVPVAAICGATFGLAVEGLLDDRPHTSNAREYLEFSGYRGGPHFVDAPVVRDGNLITATGVAPVHFARAVFELLELYPEGVAESWFKLYGDRDPAGFYELTAAG